MTWNSAVAKSYALNLAPNIICTGVLAYLGNRYAAGLLHGLDAASLYAGISTFTTGAMIAIFLAAFFSNDTRMRLLRESQHSLTIFYIVLTDLLVIIGSGAFVNTIITHASILRIVALITMIVFAVSLTIMVIRLINLLLKNNP